MSLIDQTGQKLSQPSESDCRLVAKDITVIEKRSGQNILSGVDLAIKRGEVVALIGRSGSGKSTLANTILGALRNELMVSRGSVTIGASSPMSLQFSSTKNIADQKGNENYFQQISYVMQNPGSALDPSMRIGKQVQEAVDLSALYRENKKDRTIARGLIERVGLDPDLIWNRYPHQLSIGMNQRVLISIALAKPRSFLIADEPTSSLDTTASAQIKLLLKDLAVQENIGILLITHDLAIAADIADRIYVMHEGQVVETNSALKLIGDPQHPYTKNFVCSARMLWNDKFSFNKNSEGQNAEEISPVQNPKADLPVPSLEKSMVEVKNISIGYRRDENLLQLFGRKELEIISDVSFAVKKGRICGLVGESGSGKTTLGRSLAGFIKPASDRIYINGIDIYDGNQNSETPNNNTLNSETLNSRTLNSRDLDRNRSRRSVQMVFQDPYASLDPRDTVRESLLEPLICLSGISRTNFDEKIKTTLEAVGLPDEILERRTIQLSEGQRQRLLIARSLVVEPEVLILDEPFTALDPILKLDMTQLIMRIRSELQLTIILISHDLSTVRSMADDILVLYLGKIVESGLSADVISSPYHPYTEALTSLMPAFSKKINDRTLLINEGHEEERVPIILSGELPSFTDVPLGCRFNPRCPVKQDTCSIQEPTMQFFSQNGLDRARALSDQDARRSIRDRYVACHFARPFPVSDSIYP